MQSPVPVAEVDALTLMTRCADNLGDRALWSEFHKRYERNIVTYLLRAYVAHGGTTGEFGAVAQDWTQDVFLRLVQHDARALRSFRGTNEISAAAFLACIARSVVLDHLRNKLSGKRRHFEASDEQSPKQQKVTLLAQDPTNAVNELIDVDRAVNDATNPDSARDSLIFRLFYVEGFTVPEIASFPIFQLSISGLEKVLARTRQRITQTR